MPILPLTFEVKSLMEAQLLEAGAKNKKWELYTDARIKNATMEVGPVVYLGKPDEKDAPRNDALILFQDESDAVLTILEDADPDDMMLTVDDFLTNAGADINVMKAKRPAV